MMYSVVSKLAVEGVPSMVTGRELKMAFQLHYRWSEAPVPDRVRVQAHQSNALMDANRVDREYRYRRLKDESEQVCRSSSR